MKEAIKKLLSTGDGVRAVFGFMLLIVIGALAAMIALGKVEQTTSHGLDNILGSFTTLTGGFAAWAFGSRNGNGHPPAPPPASPEPPKP